VSSGLLWLRRDLRLSDNPALEAAAERHTEVLACFCFEPGAIDGPRASGARNAYALASLTELERGFREAGTRLLFREGDAATQITELAKAAGAETVHAAEAHGTEERRGDAEVRSALAEAGIVLMLHPGATCADIGEMRSPHGKAFGDFASFLEAWQQAPRRPLARRPSHLRGPELEPDAARSRVPPQSRLGIDADARRAADAASPGEEASRWLLERFVAEHLDRYAEDRERPDLDATSRISAALSHGTISPRAVEERLDGVVSPGADALAGQLAWRDFYAHLAHHFPGEPGADHDPRFAGFPWRADDHALADWQRGRTGVPLVDAGMRQLHSEGWMHPRIRMVTATFLSKHLLIDWREGEAHFMRHLIDGDEAACNGNWQWAASTGSDPQPYFRIFSPTLQQRQFDPDGLYVRRWLPELADFPPERLAEPWKTPREVQEAAGCVIGRDYPRPMVDIEPAGERAIEAFGRHLEAAKR
jgi:deoxyribodipyrimidine photo-lyase